MPLDPLTATMQDIANKLNDLTGINNKAELLSAYNSILTNNNTIKSNLVNAVTNNLGQTASNADSFNALVSKINNVTNRGAVTIIPGTVDKAITAGYHNGSGIVKGDANLIAANILSGKSIFGVAGAITPLPTPTQGNVIIASSDETHGNPGSSTETVLKEFQVLKGGSYRLFWSIKSTGYQAYKYLYKVYVNETLIYGEHTETGNGTDYTKDITVNAGDCIRIKGFCSSAVTDGAQSWVCNFRLGISATPYANATVN